MADSFVTTGNASAWLRRGTTEHPKEPVDEPVTTPSSVNANTEPPTPQKNTATQAEPTT